MCKRLILIVIVLFSACALFAQKISVDGFQCITNDLSARTHPRKDLNGNNCALVKVLFVEYGAVFEGSVVGDVENKTNEYWVYMPADTKSLVVKHSTYLPLAISFPDFGVEHLEGNLTYKLTLVSESSQKNEYDDGMSYFAMTVSPANAIVFIDNVQQMLDDTGALMIRLPRGSHHYAVSSPGFSTSENTFNLGLTKKVISVQLESIMAQLSIKCADGDAHVFINDQYKGDHSWTGSIVPGNYLVEARKDGVKFQQKSITLQQHDSITVTFGEFEQPKGNLDISFSPIGSSVEIDGKHVGETPDVFNGLEAGDHSVRISKDGYITQTYSVSIEPQKLYSLKGQLSKQEVTPAKQKEGKPVATKKKEENTVVVTSEDSNLAINTEAAGKQSEYWHKQALASYKIFLDNERKESESHNSILNDKLQDAGYKYDTLSVINNIASIVDCIEKSDKYGLGISAEGKYKSLKDNESMAKTVLDRLVQIGYTCNDRREFANTYLALNTYINIVSHSFFQKYGYTNDTEYQNVLCCAAKASYFLRNYETAFDLAMMINTDFKRSDQVLDVLINSLKDVFRQEHNKEWITEKFLTMRKRYPDAQIAFDETYNFMRGNADFEVVEKWLKEEVQRHSENKIIWACRAQAYQDKAQYTAAIENFEHAISLDSLFYMAVFELGNCCYQQALVMIDKANAKQKKITSYDQKTTNMLDKAIMNLERVRAIDPHIRDFNWATPLLALYRLERQEDKANELIDTLKNRR